MEKHLENLVVYYTVRNDGTLVRHTMKQLELPFGPSDPGRVVSIRPVSVEEEIVQDLDDQDSETEGVIRE